MSLTRLDLIKNEFIRESLGEVDIAGKIIENRPRWYRYVERRRK